MTEQITPTTDGRGAPSVLVEPDVHAPAGTPATMRVHVRNLAPQARDVSITVIGLDDGWSPEPVVLTGVDADMTVSAEAALVPVAGAMPGDYPFVVVVQAILPGTGTSSAQTTTTLVEAVLTVDAPSEVLLVVEPSDSRMRLRRRLSVVVSNTGTEPVDLALRTQTSRGLRLELASSDLTVPARQTVRVAATARNLRPQVMGHLDRRTFSIVAQGRQAPARFSGTVTARPLVTSSMIRVVALLMVVVMWGGGLLVGLPWLTDRFTTDQVTAQEADPTAGTPGAGDPAGEPGAGEPGAPGGEPGEGEPGAGAPAAGVRVGGVVTATDPSGVTVRIAPASIIPGTTGDGVGGASGAGGGSGSGSGGALVAAPVSLTAGTSDTGPLGKTSPLALPRESTTPVAAARSTVTGDDGAWAFAGLAPTLNYLVTVSKPGYQTVRHVVSGAEASAAGLDVTLVAGEGHLSGVVTGPGGAGAGGVDVVLSDGTTTITTTTATTGVVGSWAVDGLSTPSTYLVTAQGAGLGAQSVLVPLAAGGSATVPLGLREGVASLSGTVTGPDALGFVTGVGGATVTASDGTTVRTASSLTTGLPGSFTLVDLPVPGRYELTVEAPGFATQTLALDLGADSSAAALDVRLGSSSGAVTGTVRTPAGAGLSSAGLTLHNDAGTYKTMSTSDGAGSFRLNGVSPGEYVLSAELFGHLTGYTTVTVSAGGSVTSDLVLTPVEGDGLLSTSRVRGRVSDARTNGPLTCTGLEPGQECLVTVSLTAQDVDGSQRLVSVTSDPDVEYLLPAPGEQGLLPGQYVLTVTAPGYEPTTLKVTVPMDQTVSAGQAVMYPSPSLTGTVQARMGAVPDGTCVVVTPASATAPTAPGAPTCASPTATVCQSSAGRCAFTGVNGGYVVENLPTGTYTVTVVPPEDSEYRFSGPDAEVTLSPGDVRRVDLSIDRLARLSVTTLVDRGSGSITAASGAVVTPELLKNGASTPGTPVTAGPDGVAMLDRLEAGSYSFEVRWTDLSGPTPVEHVGEITGLELSLNQERSSQVVLTRTARTFSARLVTQLAAGQQSPAEGVTVTVTGITGYNGVVPIRQSVDVVTNENGDFGTGQVGGDAPVLDLVSDTVDLTVKETTVYRALSVTGLNIASDETPTIEIQPTGQAFSGTVTLEGVEDPDGTLLKNVRFEILSSPPGAGGVSISAAELVPTPERVPAPHPAPDPPLPTASAALVWRDLTQPSPSGTTGTLARPGFYTVRASLAGFDPVEQTIEVKRGEPTTGVSFWLVRYGQVSVTTFNGCTEAACVPELKGAEITLSGPGIQQTGVAERDSNRVDFGEVPSGSYKLVVRAAGFDRYTGDITVQAGRQATTPYVVTMHRLGSITGTVRSVGQEGMESRALAGAVVTATLSGADPVVFTTVSRSDGKFDLTGSVGTPGLAAGTWMVSATLDGYTLAADVAVTVVEGAVATAMVDLDVDKVTLIVRVVEDLEGNTAINGLTLSLVNGSRTSRGPSCPTVNPACTIADGVYRFDDILPTQSTLSISGDGYRPVHLTVTPPVGLTSSAITVSLASVSNVISGTVTGQSGAGAADPMEGATVTLSGAQSGSVPPQVTTSDGTFSFTGLRDGTYTVTATRDGYRAGVRTVQVAGSQVASVDVTLFQETRQVTVTATTTNGSDLTGTLVSLTTASSVPGPQVLAGQPLVRGADGTFSTVFNQVPAGEWTATYTGTAGHPWSLTATLAAGESTLSRVIDEVRVRSSATGPPGVPGTVGVQIVGTGAAQGAGAVDVTRQVSLGGPADTVYLLAGTYTVTGSGDGLSVVVAPSQIGPSDSDVAVVATAQVATTTELTAPASWEVGDPQTLVAEVRSVRAGLGTPTGSVTFTAGTVTLGTVPLDGSGVATLAGAATALAVGSHDLVATFTGSEHHAASASSARSVTVTLRPTTTEVVGSAAGLTATKDVPLAVSVTVTRATGGAPVSGARVTVTLGGVTSGPVTTTTAGTATVTVTPTTSGELQLVATTEASMTTAGSTASVVVTVTEPPPPPGGDG